MASTSAAVKGRLKLDWEKLRCFLEDAKCYVGGECLRRCSQSSPELFNCGHMAFLTNYLYDYPALARDRGFALIPYPLTTDGFTAEGMSVGCVAPGCESLEEAYLLLAFIAGRGAQSPVREGGLVVVLGQPGPCWSAQMAESPFPSGAVRHQLDLRCYYSFFDEFVFNKLGPAINTEAGKYFLGRQSPRRLHP